MTIKYKHEIVVVGSPYSGKTTIIQKLKKGTFQKDQFDPTVNPIQPHMIDFLIDDNLHKVVINDTRGFDKNEGVICLPMLRKYCAFVIMYDITEVKSFQNALKCIEQIKSQCPVENQYMLVLGNKDDLEEERAVSMKKASKYCDSLGIQFSEISVKEDSQESLRKIFSDKLRLLMARKIAENVIEQKPKSSENIKIETKDSQKSNKQGGCC